MPVQTAPAPNAPLLPSHLKGLYQHMEVVTARAKSLVLHYEFDTADEQALEQGLQAIAAQRVGGRAMKCEFGSYMAGGKHFARVKFTPEAITGPGGRIVRDESPTNMIQFAFTLRDAGALPLDDDHMRNFAKDVRKQAGEVSAFRF